MLFIVLTYPCSESQFHHLTMKFIASVVLAAASTIFVTVASASAIIPSELTKRECGVAGEVCLASTGTLGCCAGFVCTGLVQGVHLGGVST